MSLRKITCATIDTRDTSPGNIISVGGSPWGILPRLTVADHIQLGIHSYYTEDWAGRRATVYVKGLGINRYLTTSADGTTSNNLLSLPSCG